jgi:hypothetical protein
MATTLYATPRPLLVIPTGAKRSGGTCGTAEPLVEIFFLHRVPWDRSYHGLRPNQGDDKRLGPATTLYATIAFSFVIPSVPGFPASPLSTPPLMWFSPKRTTCGRSKPQLSTGNPGKPRDLQFYGPFVDFFPKLPQDRHPERSASRIYRLTEGL